MEEKLRGLIYLRGHHLCRSLGYLRLFLRLLKLQPFLDLALDLWHHRVSLLAAL
jgi:hypothetical protein